MGSSQPEGNKIQFHGGSWIPVTPHKPVIPKPPQSPLIYTEVARNQQQANWFGSQRFSFDSTREGEASSGVACYDAGANSGYNWEAAPAEQFHGTATGEWYSIDRADKWNLPFMQLLALASDRFNSGSTSQFGLESSSVNRSYVSDTVQYEISHPYQHAFDLNFPSGTESDAASFRIASQFEPTTPDKGKSGDAQTVSELRELPTEKNRDQKEQNSECNTSISINGENLRENKEVPVLEATSTITATSAPNEKEGKHDVNLNKTPSSRQRRKKHRPKVIVEGKSKRTPKSPGSNPSKGKRRVRKNGLSKPSATPTIEISSESSDQEQEVLKPRRKSCRRVLHFDSQAQKRNELSLCRSSDSGPLEHDSHSQNMNSSTGHEEVRLEQVVSSIEPTWSRNQVQRSYNSLLEKQAPSAQIPEFRLPSDHQMKTNIEQNDRVITSFEKGNMIEIVLNNDTELFAGHPNGFNISTNPTLTYSEQATYSKRKHSDAIKLADTGSINLTGVHYNTLYAYQSIPWIHFPNICKRKRTEKGQGPTTSSAFTSESAARHFTSPEKICSFNNPEINHVVSKSDNCIAEPNGGKKHQDKLQTYRNIMAFGQSKRITKKRSRSTKQAGSESRPIYPTNQPPVDSSINIVDRSRVCMNALLENMHATVAKKKRTRKKFPTNSALSDTNKVPWLCGFIPSNSYQFFPRTIGATSEEHGNQVCYSDAIVERLKHLGSNGENNHLSYTEQALIPYGYNMQNQEHNAIVIYGQDGTMVPFTPMKKRRPRPKVELDEETNKVWKLLLENINSEGINGTEEEKIKWWEEERKVFRGRADSFIARMHLVQGDRRFSKWKGSVVDSVVGVFLTQNVSDHLSSSAFMSLAARFPPKPKCQQACYQEISKELDEPEAYMLNSEDDMKFNKQIMHQSISEHSSLMKHETERSEQQKTVDANESSGSNEDRNSNKEPELKVLNTSRIILETCSQSVGETSFIGTRALQSHGSRETRTYDSFRFQDCLDSSASQTSESIDPCMDYSSEILIQMAGLNINAQDTEVSFIDQSKTAKREIEDSFQPYDHEISIEDSANRLSSNQMQLAQTSELLDVDCYQIYDEFQTSSAPQNKDEQFKTEFTQTETVESDTRANMEAVEVEIHEAPLSSSELSINIKEHSLTLQSQGSVIEDPRIVESPTECTINLHENPSFFSSNTTGIETQSNPKDCDHSLSKEIKEMKTATSKPQRKQVGKGKESEINWDQLRKQTATNGKTRQKTENTMDSLDWEAIRCADVHEIAHTIRERGMNNMLAERIKDFLNRLVRDHGSIDLEWLRDVAPDRAKEYLLSFRGLGLKSVECVRLLTLHHLAFPVDTNVGRIAVRLGWVPLQPLPESLQLHLLEMYPVLESIQKYLWPRLCKLDQRTLYELHYQMITFGKVFCTKSKPNCNACPMRGECRHFASAFASARLGLPAPEDKRIVSTTEIREPDEKPDRIIDQQLLPAPPSSKAAEEIKPLESSHHQSSENMGINNCVPIVEEPTTPEQESVETSIRDIEDAFYEDPDEIPTIKLNIEEFSHNLQNYMEKNMELQEGDVSKALIALTPEAASIPVPKLKNVSRLRTEHQVYELPDSHPLLEKLQMDRREPDDPSSYLLAIWTPGETANSIQLPEKRCSYQECGQLCNEEECFSCNSIREANSQMVRGTLLIPCRTAMRGSFPLNGTYFQVNEVFADHDSSLNPIEVPRNWIWNLPRRTVYFGTSIPTIFKGLSTQGIQHCFWRGFVCVRGFDHKSRAPRPLMARLHFPASKLNRGRGGKTEDQ